ncbi:MAG TPA: sigma-70 family RNA polymerase sigma factor [Candidatus Polarisedimenticolia bacterium]|jgi:RNA polymerase sigma-70 factor (ECF subfamily)|nr:sigma-70 family RNA polymerase sigma factor [Candidatus Polarisedimenticolia bacterium]
MITTDRSLMKRVAGGDEPAFAELVQRYSPRLLALAWRLLGNRADAEDALQRALLRLFRSAASYRPEWAVSTWLYRITTNVCVDEMRRRASRAALRDDAVDGGADGQASLFRGAAGPGDAGRHLDLQRALLDVPREARLLLALRYVDGLSYRELARVRGISVNTVKSQLARGKAILRSALQGDPR